jgi:hypothetical protein
LKRLLELIYELVDRNAGLSQNPAESAGRQLVVEWHDAAYLTCWSRLPWNNVAASLSNLHESQALQRLYNLSAGDWTKPSHGPRRRK